MACPRCGRTQAPDLAFCTGCGHALRRGTPSRSAELPGQEERRRVCVLFIDAVGSTPFSERADPETVRALQSDFFAAVRRVVRQYGGVVEKYIGDAAMALFGAPVSTETDAVRCVRAGLDLQRVLARDGERAEGWTFRVGIADGRGARRRGRGARRRAGDRRGRRGQHRRATPGGGAARGRARVRNHPRRDYGRDPIRRPGADHAAGPHDPYRGVARSRPAAGAAGARTRRDRDGRPRP